MSWEVRAGDCVESMRAMPAGSVDAVVCDPPYHLAFMSKAWDTVTPGESQREHERWATEALRVLKPGGHLLAFGGTRTYHRLVCAVEDAGFEIRDTISWMYASGFPKSLDVGKAIDRAAGAEREVVGKTGRCTGPSQAGSNGIGTFKESNWEQSDNLTAPATPEAEQWQGWGTALKPAHEPVVVARKPLSGTVSANVLEHSTGALNVDGCRVGTQGGGWNGLGDTHDGGWRLNNPDGAQRDGGRWPANVVLSHSEGCVPVGTRRVKSQKAPTPSATRPSGYAMGGDYEPVGYADADGMETVTAWECEPDCAVRLLDEQTGAEVSRFFYCSKAGREERSAGLNGNRSSHPTVKPIELMRWLVRLVTPPGGTVLDPFCGSGSTGCAAVLEGFDFVGLEREEEYVEIARARIGWWEKHRGDGKVAQVLAAGEVRDGVEATGQLDMFGEAA